MRFETHATRSERVALVKSHWEGADRDVGPSETKTLVVCEADEHDQIVAIVNFDPVDLDAACAELDARYDSGKGASFARSAAVLRALERVFASRDWDASSGVYDPDLVVNDHRPLGWETIRGLAAYVETYRSMVERAPDVRLSIDHLTLSDRAILMAFTWIGTREGGAFEIPKVSVCETDETGRIFRIDVDEVDQLEEARARFDALGRQSRSEIPLR